MSVDNLRFINLETFKITDIPENYIYADKGIVESIALLNKKGYITRASCSGHPGIKMNQWIDKKENLDKYKYTIPVKLNNPNEIPKEKIAFEKVLSTTRTYIMFEKEYVFPDLPTGFIKQGKTISRETDLFDENNNAYEDEVIQKQIDMINKELLNWVISLD